MPRRALHDSNGLVFHVLNRSARRVRIFRQPADYQAFEKLLVEGIRRSPVGLLGYILMPNHWHLVLRPGAAPLPRFMHWLTLTHTKRWHTAHGSAGYGAVYQGRYHALPVVGDAHLLSVVRYVERNALQAGLVRRAEHWRWGSLWHRVNGSDKVPLAEWSVPMPDDWVEVVNKPWGGL